MPSSKFSRNRSRVQPTPKVCISKKTRRQKKFTCTPTPAPQLFIDLALIDAANPANNTNVAAFAIPSTAPPDGFQRVPGPGTSLGVTVTIHPGITPGNFQITYSLAFYDTTVAVPGYTTGQCYDSGALPIQNQTTLANCGTVRIYT